MGLDGEGGRGVMVVLLCEVPFVYFSRGLGVFGAGFGLWAAWDIRA